MPADPNHSQYFRTFSGKAVDSAQFKACLFAFFDTDAEATAALEAVDWDMWYHKPGPYPKPNFHSERYDNCTLLADKWELLSQQGHSSSYQPSAADVQGWTVGQFLVFLDRLIQAPSPVPTESASQHLGLSYGLKKSRNFEVLSRYLRVALRAGDRGAIDQTLELLGQTGRMKFVRPLYVVDLYPILSVLLTLYV